MQVHSVYKSPNISDNAEEREENEEKNNTGGAVASTDGEVDVASPVVREFDHLYFTLIYDCDAPSIIAPVIGLSRDVATRWLSVSPSTKVC